MTKSRINDIQEYLGVEAVHHWRDGLISRRELLRQLTGICGTAAAGAALLAACSSSDTGSATSASTVAATAAPATTSAAATTAAPTTAAPTTAPASTVATTAAATTAAPTTAAASAARPPSPLSVSADDPAVTGSDITFAGPAGPLLAYTATPKTPLTGNPGVLVIHENVGVTPHIKDVTRRLAKAGFTALAIDLTSRAGGTAKGNVSTALGQLPAADAIADLTAAVKHLNTLTSGKIGVTGFCYGGGMTLRAAANVPGLSAAVSYYGPVPDPADQMKKATIPILGHYGSTDARVNGTIPAIEANVGGLYTKHIHEGAAHAFNNDTGNNYNQAAATTAWTETLAWFTKHLA